MTWASLAVETMPGNKSKLTQAMTKKLCEALSQGNTRRASCHYAGISEDSFANYLRDSSDFSDAVARAEAAAEQEMVGVIRKAAQEGHFQAAEWWLERHPKVKADWRQVSGVEMSGELNVKRYECVDEEEV